MDLMTKMESLISMTIPLMLMKAKCRATMYVMEQTVLMEKQVPAVQRSNSTAGADGQVPMVYSLFDVLMSLLEKIAILEVFE